NVLTGLRCQNCRWRMPMIRCSDDQDIDIFAFQRATKVAKSGCFTLLKLLDGILTLIDCPAIYITDVDHPAVGLCCEVLGQGITTGIHTHHRYIESLICSNNIIVALCAKGRQYAPQTQSSRGY